MSSIVVAGVFLGSERRSGDFTPDDRPTEKVQFDYTVLNVLTGMTVTEVRLPKGVHTHRYAEGETVEVPCTLPKGIRPTATLDVVAVAEPAA